MTAGREIAFITRQRMEDNEHGYITPARCYFNALGLCPSNMWSPLDYMDWISDRQKEYNALTRAFCKKPEDFWESFNEWLIEQTSGSTYVLYQPEKEHFNAPLAAWKKWGLTVYDYYYEIAWSGKLEKIPENMDDFAAKFNSDPPKTFGRHPIKIGDVIVVSDGKKRAAWFYDTGGFVRIPNFERVRWQKKENEEGKNAKDHQPGQAAEEGSEGIPCSAAGQLARN